MYPLDLIQEQEKRIQCLEKELTELRQGLAAVHDYFLEIRAAVDEKSASAELNFGIVRPLKEEDAEFEGIWDFHQKMLVGDPAGSIPLDIMYDTFSRFCQQEREKACGQGCIRVSPPADGRPPPGRLPGKMAGMQAPVNCGRNGRAWRRHGTCPHHG